LQSDGFGILKTKTGNQILILWPLERLSTNEFPEVANPGVPGLKTSAVWGIKNNTTAAP